MHTAPVTGLVAEEGPSSATRKWPRMPAAEPRARILAPVVLGLSSLAWLALALWGQSPYARYLDHKQIDADAGSVLLPVFLLGWLLMLIAMMLPTTLPRVRVFGLLVHSRPECRRLQLIVFLVLGYLSSWTVLGCSSTLRMRRCMPSCARTRRPLNTPGSLAQPYSYSPASTNSLRSNTTV
jgi:predicted metal-binding membrane protein